MSRRRISSGSTCGQKWKAASFKEKRSLGNWTKGRIWSLTMSGMGRWKWRVKEKGCWEREGKWAREKRWAKCSKRAIGDQMKGGVTGDERRRRRRRNNAGRKPPRKCRSWKVYSKCVVHIFEYIYDKKMSGNAFLGRQHFQMLCFLALLWQRQQNSCLCVPTRIHQQHRTKLRSCQSDWIASQSSFPQEISCLLVDEIVHWKWSLLGNNTDAVIIL